MSTWIDIDLPYSDTGVFLHPGQEPPDLDAEERSRFGTTRDALWDKHLSKILEIQELETLTFYDKALELGVPEEDMDDTVAKMLAEWLDDHPDYREAQKAQELRGISWDWQAQHPKTIAYREAHAKALKEDALKTFTGQGLAKPGVQVEMAGGETYLIGDVNPLGGVCDDCAAFDSTDIVVRYRVLVPSDKLSVGTP